MHRIDCPTATPDNRFTEGDPTIPVAATTVTADWLNSVQEELVAPILAADMELDKTKTSQLLEAILALVAKRAPLATTARPGLVRPDGTTLTVDEEGVLSAVQNADATVARLEDLRKLSIGAPKFHRSTNLPPNHAWPDGSFVEFEDWPELAEVYEQGGFTGMLLPWDAGAATQAANLGKFRPDAANPTGLYLPLHGGQFFRAWTLGQGADAGAWHRDEIRNIEGIFSGGYGHGSFTGPFRNIGVSGSYSGDTAPLSSVQFNASNVVSTGPQNVPQHIWQPIIIYLGSPR